MKAKHTLFIMLLVAIMAVSSVSCDGQDAKDPVGSVQTTEQTQVILNDSVIGTEEPAPTEQITTTEQTEMPTTLITEQTEHITSVMPTQTELPQQKSLMLDEKYLKIWYKDDIVYSDSIFESIQIYEITPDSFDFGYNYGIMAFCATAVERNGEIVFGDGISPNYTGPASIKGRLKFENNSISVIFDDAGIVPYLPEGEENVSTFTIRKDIDPYSLLDFKAGHPSGSHPGDFVPELTPNRGE